MIEKIASDVLNKLNATSPRDFDDKVGLEDHLRKIESLLELDNDGVKMVAISGPAGIGKTTIARALHSQLSTSFHGSCFMNKLKKSYQSGYDEYDLKLSLQVQLLSKVLNQNAMTICHLGVIKDRLRHQKVLIILDDVDILNQLEVLADIRWYGPGSRIIVITENRKILQQHGINDIYHVNFPSKEEALMIFCLSAFRQTSPPDGFVYLVDEVVRICSNLPLGLKVLGSSLKGKNLDDWELELPRLKDSLDGRIESVLQLGYKSLNEEDKVTFLCIAVFFIDKPVDYVISIMDEPNLNVRLGLNILANRYLIHVDNRVEMHHLLKLMARQIISTQDSRKRQILVNPREICYVLEKAKGNESVVGISLEVADIKKLTINTKAFDKMFNLLFLKVYDRRWTDPYPPTKIQIHIPEEIEFPPHLRLLHWEAYPRESLPLGFCTENLVKLHMRYSQLEKLWDGIQPLANLKEMDFYKSSRLKELPDLSNATNLEDLYLVCCSALVQIPSSIKKLYKLRFLGMDNCKSLEVIPSLANLTSLQGDIWMSGCSKLRIVPDIPTHICSLAMEDTLVEKLPASLKHCSRLDTVYLSGCGNLRTFLPHLPTSVKKLDLSDSGIERITDCIKGLHNLESLYLSSCKRLVSLPELPSSLERLDLSNSSIKRIPNSIKGLHNLKYLYLSSCKRLVLLPEPPSSLHFLKAENCDSLERISGPLNTPYAELDFTNCFKLDSQARQAIIQQSYIPEFEYDVSYSRGCGLLPGREVPKEFIYRSSRSSLTIPPSTFNRVKGCIVISQKLLQDIFCPMGCNSNYIWLYCKINGNLVQNIGISSNTIQAEYLIIFGSDVLSFDPSKVSTEIVLECRHTYEVCFEEYECRNYPLDIIEWGIQILTDENRSNNEGSSNDNIDTHKSNEISKKEEGDDEEESGEASKDKDECIADTYESIPMKCPREKTITSAAINLKRDIKDDICHQETGKCFSALEFSSLTGGDYYEFVSRKSSRKTMITSATTGLKRVIHRLFSKKKEK